jgi:twitching motility two-component system response regulator PilG
MKKLLIVEDTMTIPTLIKVYLMGWELEFHHARDGAEGLKMARELKPDLILSDVQMPGMDGFELCAQVRADKELFQVPIVLLTSLKDDASRRKGTLVGATAFLSKPVMVDELRERVGALLKVQPKVPHK